MAVEEGLGGVDLRPPVIHADVLGFHIDYRGEMHAGVCMNAPAGLEFQPHALGIETVFDERRVQGMAHCAGEHL